MKTDAQLQKDVCEELAFEPALDETKIGVIARDGVITLTGTVASYPELLAAERAAKRVAGVRGIAEELKIEIPRTAHRSDADIARSAVIALDWDVVVPKSMVTVKVENGWLTLSGEVNFPYQKDAARRAVEHLVGVRGVTNSITLKLMPSLGDVRRKIREAFERNAEIDANKVEIDLKDGIVTLNGEVHSWNERDEATYAASSVPGVKGVNNYTHVV